MGILAKHKITGKVAVVSEGNLKANPNLIPATEEEIDASKRADYMRVFGYVPDVIPAESKPNSSWTKADLISYAEGKKISVDESMTKAELLEALEEGN